MKLDKQQKVAVECSEQPTLVLAGPGSGKTLVLTHRAAHLVKERKVNPESLVLCTFTKKASQEMELRLRRMLPWKIVSKMQISTIHALCYKMMRAEGDNRKVIQDRERKRIIEEILAKQMHWEVGPLSVLSWITRAKQNFIEVENSLEWFWRELEPHDRAEFIAQQLNYAYELFQKELDRAKLIEFSDMIFQAARRLSTGSWKCWQEGYTHILIDEFQDTSDASLKVLYLLAKPQDQIFAVGDPDQLLYRFAGANPDSNVFGFTDRYVGGQVFKLETNYRSTPQIVDASAQLIGKNYVGREDYMKKLQPRDGVEVGPQVYYQEHPDVKEEARAVTASLLSELSYGANPGQFFILYRTNAQSRSVEELMFKMGVPYVLLRGVGFYNRKHIKDVLCYLRLMVNCRDDEAFGRICNIASANHFKHYRGFGRAFIRDCKAQGFHLWKGMINLYSLTRFKSAGRDDFLYLMDELGFYRETPEAAVKAVRDLCYDDYLNRSEGLVPSDEGYVARIDDLRELEEAAKGFGSIEELLAFVVEIQAASNLSIEDMDQFVVLSTVHGVKGLERDFVYVVGLSQGILPHAYALGDVINNSEIPFPNDSRIDDERCILYVAITRARKEVHLNSVQTYRGKSMPPSIFTGELQGHLIPGMSLELPEPMEQRVRLGCESQAIELT